MVNLVQLKSRPTPFFRDQRAKIQSKVSARYLRGCGLSVLSLVVAIGILSCTSTREDNSIHVFGPVTIPSNGWQVPVDVSNSYNPSRNDWLELGWETFIALSWPANSTGLAGQPDETVSITDFKIGPTVWSTYLAKEQLFQPLAADPGTWASPTNETITLNGLPVLNGWSKKNPDLDGEFNEAFSDAPLIDTRKNYVLFEIRMNEAEFTYVELNKYYDANMQKEAFMTNPSSFVPFPKTGKDIIDPSTKQAIELPDWAQQGALEVKASWRILTSEDDNSRYYTQEAYVMTPDKQTEGPYTLGLVGLHILRLTPMTGSTWFWATFEQVDNLGELGHSASFYSSTLPEPGDGGYSYMPPKIVIGQPLPVNPTPVNVSRVFPIPGDVALANASYQGLLKDSVWKYYQMIEVQNPVDKNAIGATPVPHNPNAFSNTDRMANVTMETYEQIVPANTNQSTSTDQPQSCVNCHGQFGFPQGAPTTPSNQIFTFLLGDAQSPM